MALRRPSARTIFSFFFSASLLAIFSIAWFRPTERTARSFGPLAESFESEILGAFRALGGKVDPSSCYIISKSHLLVTCRATGIPPERVIGQFVLQGWKQANASKPRGPVLFRGNSYLYVDDLGRSEVVVGIRDSDQ